MAVASRKINIRWNGSRFRQSSKDGRTSETVWHCSLINNQPKTTNRTARQRLAQNGQFRSRTKHFRHRIPGYHMTNCRNNETGYPQPGHRRRPDWSVSAISAEAQIEEILPANKPTRKSCRVIGVIIRKKDEREIDAFWLTSHELQSQWASNAANSKWEAFVWSTKKQIVLVFKARGTHNKQSCRQETRMAQT